MKWASTLVLLTCAVSAVLAETAEPRNVILIGWDGCQREHLNQMIARSEVPHLIALSKEGSMVDIQVTTGATDTKAGWSQILTGFRPETTGVYSNNRYRPIPRGLTMFERVEKHLGADAVYTAMVVGKKGHVDNDAPRRVPHARWLKNSAKGPLKNLKPQARLRRLGATIIEENGRKFVQFPGKPYYLVQNGMDRFVNGLNTNERVATHAMDLIEKNKHRRLLMFVHFARPDHDGHQHGENSAQYSAGIRDDDAWTGRIIAKLKDLKLYDDTLVYIVADHGFDEGLKTHKNAPSVFMATNDPKVKGKGDRADIAPTILDRFGIDLAKLDPKPDGKPLG